MENQFLKVSVITISKTNHGYTSLLLIPYHYRVMVTKMIYRIWGMIKHIHILLNAPENHDMVHNITMVRLSFTCWFCVETA